MQTTAIKVKGYSVSRQIVGGFWKGDIDLRDLLVDPEESQLLNLKNCPAKRGITRDHTPFLLILQGMTLQLQGIALPPF